MTSKLTLNIKSRGKPIRGLPQSVTISPSESGAELHNRIAGLARTDPARLRITKASDGAVIANAKDVKISIANLSDNETIQIKDLGPQIAWRTVFIIEYLGPLLIHPLVYLLRPYLYTSPSITGIMPEASVLQKLSLAMICIHFAKREVETMFVHRFSASTMPMQNIFKNSAHYWLLSGLNIAYWTYSPSSPTQSRPFSLEENPLAFLGVAMFIFGELFNLNSHLVLKNLRPSGTTQRGIPSGFGFKLVTCPNYMFETVAWVGIWLVNWSLSTGLFAAIAVAQMAAWAIKKEKRYRKEFGDKYKKKRYSMLPGII